MHPNDRPLIIGITGSIGGGKTTLCKYIEQYCPVYYADSIAHQVLIEPDHIQAMTARWGTGILDDNLIVNRKAIAEIVFNNPFELAFLNALVHPGVLRIMQEIVDNSKADTLFFEVPILFEANLQNCFDYIVLLLTSREVRKHRIEMRDMISFKAINARIATQAEDEVKAGKSDIVIRNDGSVDELLDKATAFLKTIPDIPFRDITPFS